MNTKTQEHPSTCRTCGEKVPYLGRRDLIAVVHAAYAKLAGVPDDDLTNWRARALVVRVDLGEALGAATGLCATCAFPDDAREAIAALREAVSAPTGGHCGVCGRQGVGVGPEHRCPTLGCAGSIAKA